MSVIVQEQCFASSLCKVCETEEDCHISPEANQSLPGQERFDSDP